LYESESDAGNTSFFFTLLDEAAEFGDAGLLERVRFLTCERFARVALGEEASEDEGFLASALLADCFGDVLA